MSHVHRDGLASSFPDPGGGTFGRLNTSWGTHSFTLTDIVYLYVFGSTYFLISVYFHRLDMDLSIWSLKGIILNRVSLMLLKGFMHLQTMIIIENK